MVDREFSDIFPHTDVPILPEYFKKATIEGLLPCEVAYPYDHIIGFDTLTQQLCIRTRQGLDVEAHAPDFITGRVGIMRVHEAVDGVTIDGYIADLRHVAPGGLESITFTLPEAAGEDEREHHKRFIEEDGIMPLLAAVFTDPDGKLHYMGDMKWLEKTEALLDRVDEVPNIQDFIGEVDEISRGDESPRPDVE